ncbi:hypothetical protein LWI28_022250 [Acer negundo]|uniref:Uncharacterized protein n=1 Tax=Acer negundo TaxID=4023 RepID=A0AAD5J108_ACENE|nr:hypothetical protein LWI28_022250 [Acer negundo]
MEGINSDKRKKICIVSENLGALLVDDDLPTLTLSKVTKNQVAKGERHTHGLKWDGYGFDPNQTMLEMLEMEVDMNL